MVAMAIEIVIQGSRFRDGSRKITNIGEVLALNPDGSYATKDIFKFEYEGVDDAGKVQGKVVWTGYMPTWVDEIEAHGVSWDHKIFDPSKAPKGKGTSTPMSKSMSGGGH